MYTLELTEEELEFVYTRCLRKAMRLEESHLECSLLPSGKSGNVEDLR